MKIPRVKDLKSKLSSAKLLGIVVKNSLQFKLRRGALPRFRNKDFDVIIVDMDGTLFRSDANLEALKFLYPEKTGKISHGEEIYDSILSNIAKGNCSIEQAILDGNKFLIGKKMNRMDFEAVFEKLKPTLRTQLVKALKKMKKEGKTIILATLSSKDFAEVANKHLQKMHNFAFDHLIGTSLAFDENGFITGVNSIIGTKDYDLNGIPVKTKLTGIREFFSANGKELELKKTLLITDSYGDIDLAKMLVTILLKPKTPTTAQKVSQSLRLADYMLRDDSDLQKNLESIVLGPKK
ncbi:MAG TPA: HAD family hydrolase [archaeon]|nr:HAD family hydrolase [archaeon]